VVASAPNALVVAKDFPAKNVAELIAMAKEDPGKLSLGSSGIGGANHLSGELLSKWRASKSFTFPTRERYPR